MPLIDYFRQNPANVWDTPVSPGNQVTAETMNKLMVNQPSRAPAFGMAPPSEVLIGAAAGQVTKRFVAPGIPPEEEDDDSGV